MAFQQLGSQIAFLRRLTYNLGAWTALKVRTRMLLRGAGFPVSAVCRLQPPCLAHPVEMRIGTTDEFAYHQVLREREYGALDGVADPRIIVDCGANVGYASAYFLSRFPNAHVIAVEPFAANAEQCRRNLAPYGARATVHEAAIWSRAGRLKVDVDAGGGEWAVRVRETHAGETGDIDALAIPQLGVTSIDILKIDIERSEIELFGNAADAWLAGVRNIAIELHDENCSRVFFDALAGYDYTRSQSGELTILRDIRRHDAPA